MESARPGARVTSRPEHLTEAEILTDYCSRPACRTEFRRAPGPGRRQAYCSEICRRTAERELRQARSRLAHFEDLVEKLRIDVAAFGKTDTEPNDNLQSSQDARRVAEDAMRRASGALAFANPAEPAVQELRRLHEAVTPLVLPFEQAG